MKRLLLLTGLLVAASLPALGTSFYESPDVPTDDPPTGAPTYLPWEIVRNDSGSYSLKQNLPPNTAIDAVFHMNSGDWLFSVEAMAELPPGSGAYFEPRDLVLFDGSNFFLFFSGAANGIPAGTNVDAAFLVGGDSGDPILSFDVPTTIGAATYQPSDLVRFSAGPPVLYFDASAATPPVPAYSNVIGADERHGLTVLTFDVPTTIGPVTYMPGELVAWDPVAMSWFSYWFDPNWPISSVADAFSFLATPGFVPPTITVDKSMITAGDLTVSWTPSCSVGGEDYGIYEGVIGTWYSHTAVTCTDALGDYTEEVTPASGGRYYLVVPMNSNDEGSYGLDSSGLQRPPGSTSCMPTQELGTCP